MVACVTREKQDLLDALCAVRQEIKAYPTPIAGLSLIHISEPFFS